MKMNHLMGGDPLLKLFFFFMDRFCWNLVSKCRIEKENNFVSVLISI